jgi:hypothetical protein
MGLVSAATAARRTPVWNPPPAGRSALPGEAERETVRVLAELPSGAARGLLTDLVRRASAGPAGASAGPLVLAACGAARELAALERHLEALEAQSDQMTTTSGGLDALARCEQRRGVLVWL